VRFLTYNVDPVVLVGMSTRAGGEIAQAP
jgi:hypothetical protein